MNMKIKIILCLTVALTSKIVVSEARIKMVALPDRAHMYVSLTNPGAALVEEERIITLQKGVNRVDFSWGGVSIDSQAIRLRVLDHPNETIVLNTSYPPNENALIWEISSAEAREERIRISYLIHGLNRDVVHKAVAESSEKSMVLRSYLRLRNDSGEDISDADISIGYGADFRKTIVSGEVLEMLSERIDGVPMNKILTWDAAEQPWDPEYENSTVGLPLSYVIKNDHTSKLGQHSILPGKARIFLKTGPDGKGVAFTGEDWAELTPVDRELKLSIGQSRDVKVTQRRMKSDRTNIRRTTSNREILWDLEEAYKLEIENFKKTPVDLVIVEHLPGYWKMKKTTHDFKKKDAFTIEYHLTLPKESKQTLSFDITRLNVQNNEPSSY